VGCSYTLVERSKEWDLGGLPMPALVTAGELRSEQDAGWPWTSTPPVVPPTHPLAGRVAYSDGRYLRSKNTWIRDLLWVGPGSVVETLKRELGLSPADIIAVPAYYTGRWSGPPPAIGTPSPPGRVVEEAEAIVPGAANFQVFGTNLFVADQFAPPSWESDLQARLVASAGSGVFPLRLTWIDDWDVYHRLSGEVHCGSNVEKKPPAQERWWEVQP
jgi:hypothetical protein